MPAVGDQHKLNGTATANPFEETKPRISEYTAQEIATLQSRLNKRLGPEFISTRPGPGNQKVAYLSAEKAINLANEVFGFNGWSSSIQNIQIDFVDENAQTGKVTLGLSVVVRVTLKDGTYHEDIGYGGIENCKGKAMAFEKSKKEATTDALKRALRSFGNVLGNCMYDKDYVTKVSRVKPGNGRFDVSELHRHPDFMAKVEEDVKPAAKPAPIVSNTPSLEFEDSFDVSEFDDIDFTDNDLTRPDEILIPADSNARTLNSSTRPGVSNISTPSKQPQPRGQNVQVNGQSRPLGQQPVGFNPAVPGPSTRSALPAARSFDNTGSVQVNNRGEERHLSSPGIPSGHFPPQQAPGVLQAGFYSAKAAKDIDPITASALPPSAVKFNPYAQSPSIRKTAGVDHTKSVPVRRELLQKAETILPPNAAVDSRSDQTRRSGMPGPVPSAVGRPGMSTSAYRPPTRNASPAISHPAANPVLPPGGADRALTAAKRPPLVDVSNVQHSVTAQTTDGADTKRQRLSTGGSIAHSDATENA